MALATLGSPLLEELLKLGAQTGLRGDETFYVLITATTGASTDIALQDITITVKEA